VLGGPVTGQKWPCAARTVECSICSRDPDECPHITGRSYDGKCCIRMITDLDLIDVSLVARPKQPDARTCRIEQSSTVIRGELREGFCAKWAGRPASISHRERQRRSGPVRCWSRTVLLWPRRGG
jgi:hypothetical protein